MYNIDWDIRFDNKYQLAILGELEIVKSVDNLADTAVIVLPEAVMNEVLDFEQLIGRGTEVLIRLGYDGELKNEFSGYIREIAVNDSSLKIRCEDALFLFRVGVPDKEMKGVSLKQVAQYVIDHVDPDFTLQCDYEVNYEKFTIHQATGYDVLKKLQEETKANIYFDTENKTLHIHKPYLEKGGEVYYSMQKNIENSSLDFKTKLDTKHEVTVESTDINGIVHKVTVGTTGGDKTNWKVGSMDEASMREIAKEILKKKAAPSYDGTFDTWLVPFVAPSWSARIKDADYPDKEAWYYVKSVTTSISEGGGKRVVTPGVKLVGSVQ